MYFLLFFHRAEIFQKLGPRCRGTLRTKSRGAFRNEQLQHCFNTLGLETNKKQLFLFAKKNNEWNPPSLKKWSTQHENVGFVVLWICLWRCMETPPKTNMIMETQTFEDVSPIKTCDFPASHVRFWGVTLWVNIVDIYQLRPLLPILPQEDKVNWHSPETNLLHKDAPL